jgi:hypothetical protein
VVNRWKFAPKKQKLCKGNMMKTESLRKFDDVAASVV